MAKEIVKINEVNVAVVDTVEVRKVYSKIQLETEKSKHAERIVEIDELLNALTA